VLGAVPDNTYLGDLNSYFAGNLWVGTDSSTYDFHVEGTGYFSDTLYADTINTGHVASIDGGGDAIIFNSPIQKSNYVYIYVDPVNGDDSNNGLDNSDKVKTLDRVFEIIKDIDSDFFEISSYNSNESNRITLSSGAVLKGKNVIFKSNLDSGNRAYYQFNSPIELRKSDIYFPQISFDIIINSSIFINQDSYDFGFTLGQRDLYGSTLNFTSDCYFIYSGYSFYTTGMNRINFNHATINGNGYDVQLNRNRFNTDKNYVIGNNYDSTFIDIDTSSVIWFNHLM